MTFSFCTIAPWSPPRREPDESPGRRERKKQRTAETIRHAATELFLAQGYDGTTTEQIAEAADVSVSTFFRYFPTKESVLLRTADGAEVVRRGLERAPRASRCGRRSAGRCSRASPP